MGVPELGKARYTPIDKLEAGMKVHRDVEGRGGKVLVGAGEVLSRKHIEKLKSWESREKPHGPALPKRNPKDRTERVQHQEFQGGWRPSHFNPQGVLVSATLASGDETPSVERNPELSKHYQETVRGAHPAVSIPAGEESDVVKIRDLHSEIKALQLVNAQIGGSLSMEATKGETLADYETLRDSIRTENDRIITELKTRKLSDDTAETVATGRKARRNGRR